MLQPLEQLYFCMSARAGRLTLNCVFEGGSERPSRSAQADILIYKAPRGRDVHADGDLPAQRGDPRAQLAAVLRRLAAHSAPHIDELLCWN